jgi:hypothetical protein
MIFIGLREERDLTTKARSSQRTQRIIREEKKDRKVKKVKENLFSSFLNLCFFMSNYVGRGEGGGN